MAETNQAAAQAEPVEETEVTPAPKRKRGFVIAVVVLLVLLGLELWWRSTYTEDTDDAQVNGHLIQVSARISGQVVEVDVDENQQVKQGQVIAKLDPGDYQVAVENAQAALDSAMANAQAAGVNVPITETSTGSTLTSANADVSGAHASVSQAQKQLAAAQARVGEAIANNTKAEADLKRYTPLVEKDVISKLQYDATVATARSTAAALADAEATEEAAQDGIRVATEREKQSEASQKSAMTGPQQVALQSAHYKQAQAQVEQAQAQLDQAKLNRSYCTITAPEDGIITRKSVEINQNVSPGQNLLTLVSLKDLWITANFKETQLKHMFAGQKVEIHVDSTGKDYSGKVTQIGGATGSVLSLFPPENATGNYVKVVQRVPVRIDFTNLDNEDPNHQLRPGLSLEPKVRVK